MGEDERQGQMDERDARLARQLDQGLDGVELGGHLRTRRREALRHAAGPSPLGQGGVPAVPAGEPSAVERAPGDHPHAVALAGGQHGRLDAPGEDGVGGLLALEPLVAPALGHPVRLHDEVGGEGAAADGPDLALVDQVRQRPQGVVDVAGGVGAVDLVQVDPVGAQAPKARLHLPHDPPPGVPRHVGVGAHGAVDLGGEDDVVAPPAGQRLGHDLLGLPARVDVGGVDEVDPGVEGGVDDADAVVVVGVAPRPEHHGAQAQGGDPHAGASQGVQLHVATVRCAGVPVPAPVPSAAPSVSTGDAPGAGGDAGGGGAKMVRR